MKKQTIGVVFLTLAVVLLGTSAAYAAADIRANLDERGIGFETSASYRALTVHIAGEGKTVERVFKADSTAYISPADFNLPDGQYKYEAVLTPDNENLTRRANRSERAERTRDDNVLFGTFRIQGGAIILDNGEVEPDPAMGAPGDRPNGLVSATEEQTFVTDVEIQGSLCVGFDCTTSESFGFDTLRLKENNLRIHFNDTSASASFPTNDWRIVANDTTNGGANYLGIEDSNAGRMPFRVEAGAPANTLYVEADGDVGIKTANPVVDLHVVEGNTPTLRLEQDGSDGFQAQTWDVAGNEANFFIRDVTNGSKLSFRIRPGAPESSIDIAANGDVGIGTSSPQEDLHIRNTGAAENAEILLEAAGATGTGNKAWELIARGVDGEFAINDRVGAGAEFIFSGPNAATPGLDLAGTLDASEDVIAGDQLICNGAAGACLMETSDIRLKPNAVEIEAAAAIIRDLRPIQWSNEAGETSTGLAAQQVAEVMERHGVENWTGHGYMVDQDKHFLSYTALIGVLVGAHQDKDAQIGTLTNTIETLLQRIDRLEARFED